MRSQIIIRCAAAIFAMLSLNACSTLAQRAARADGLLDFLGGDSAGLANKIETTSDGGGRIITAKLKAYGSRVYVSGLVSRATMGHPRYGSHIDVLVLDGRGQVIETVSISYQPREIPHGRRGTFPHSRYTARLSVHPPADASVRVVFHSGPSSACLNEHHRPSISRSEFVTATVRQVSKAFPERSGDLNSLG